jgi:hypothetical protein
MGKGPFLATISLGVFAALVSLDAQVGSRRLTIDDIYSPDSAYRFQRNAGHGNLVARSGNLCQS